MRTHRLIFPLAILALIALVPLSGNAQEAKLKIRVTPKQAYVFVDGKAIGDGHRTVSLPAGAHEVGVYNYGYRPDVRSVTLTAGQTTTHEVSLQAAGGSVTGPWGRIQIEGGDRAAVLLNGKTPDYLVGHGDEFNHDFIWKQELIVPPGTHQLTLLRDGSEIWSGTVTVAANQKVTIHAGGAQKTADWSRGRSLTLVPRFKAGWASATVAVGAPMISSFTANPAEIRCGQSSRLAWQTSEATGATLENEAVSPSGEKLVSPRATTTYHLVATGPGGRNTQSAAVNVNAGVTASLSAAPDSIRYHRIGEKVVEHTSSTLTWSSANAESVAIDPLGAVSPSGSRSVQPAPRQTAAGPVNETVTYTLAATNACGGSATRSASLRITGAIEAAPEVLLHSVFFPTDYPDENRPDLGLLASQRRALSLLADGFKKYMEADPGAQLLLEAHADERRSRDYNRALSERRAARVKQFLVDAGIPASRIDYQGFGEDQNLDRASVESLEKENPDKAPRVRLQSRQANWLAHNRRVDVVLRPSGERSLRFYPHAADDSRILWQVPKPSRRVIEQNQ